MPGNLEHIQTDSAQDMGDQVFGQVQSNNGPFSLQHYDGNQTPSKPLIFIVPFYRLPLERRLLCSHMPQIGRLPSPCNDHGFITLHQMDTQGETQQGGDIPSTQMVQTRSSDPGC